jgi:small subunit ribosomal protein S18
MSNQRPFGGYQSRSATPPRNSKRRPPINYSNTTEQSAESGEGSSNFQRTLIMRKQFYRRRRVCIFSGEDAIKIDYKDVRTLTKFVSERGKIMPGRISGVSHRRQRELSQAIRRARFLALMPYVNV